MQMRKVIVIFNFGILLLSANDDIIQYKKKGKGE